MNEAPIALALLLGFSLFAGNANAHISVASGPAYADTTQEIVFGVGHGCEGDDTYSVQVEIPREVLTVRAVNSDLGRAQVELDENQSVRAVSWQKPEESLLDADTNYYKLTLRIKVPNQPFTVLYFPTHQVCQSSTGKSTAVDWISTSDDESTGEPAPALKILPKRFSGWNKFKIPGKVTDLSSFFSDAVIVWKGDAAYSANPTTADLIASTTGVFVLSALDADDDIWVRY